MKKSFLLLWLFTTTVCLTACWSKNYNMTFEEALDIANNSKLQDFITENENFEQNFQISGIYNAKWIKVDADIFTNSKQSKSSSDSESSTNFAANINYSGDNIKVNWNLDLKLVNDTIYINLWSLDLTWREDLALINMMTSWLDNQWFSISMTWVSDVPNNLSYFKNSDKLSARVNEIVINEWSVVYSWKFEQFNGYNARKFSLDNEKLNMLIKEYYNIMSDNLDVGSGETLSGEIPDINIQNFEWYLIITWKDKVTTVIENMDSVDNDMVINVNWFAGKDFELNINNGEMLVMKIMAKRNFSKYNISVTFDEAVLPVSLNWSISPKLSKSWISLKFNAKLTIKAKDGWDSDTIVPFKGLWNYRAISDFSVSAPENAQDLAELLGINLWWEIWDSEYVDNLSENGYNESNWIEDWQILWVDVENLENEEEVTTIE